MNKLWEIGKAWTNVVAGSEETKELAKERMKVCQTCEHKKVSDLLNVEVCGLCHCPLLGKTHSPLNGCPAKKWVK